MKTSHANKQARSTASTAPSPSVSTHTAVSYANRRQMIDRILQLKGGRTITQCATDWGVDVRELSKILRGDPHRYPGERLLARLGLGKEEVVWPIRTR